MIVTDPTKADNPIIFVNQAFTRVTGYSSEEAVGRNCRFLQGADTDRQIVADIRQAITRALPIRCELLNYRKDGSAFWADLAIDPIKDAAGNLIRCIGIQYDASEKHAALSKRLEADQLLADIINHVPGYVFQRIMQPDGTLSYPYFSASIFRILGLPDNTDWTSGQSVQYLHPDERDHSLRAIIQSGTDLTRLLSEFRFISSSGEEHWFRTDSTPRALPDGAVVWNGLAVNISAQKSSESRLERLAYHDGLTGLANRVAFRDQLLRRLSRDSTGTSRSAIFYIDLDGFEVINEDAGYAFGDRVLRRIGLLLKEFSESHKGSAARLGGDEFAVVLPALSTGTSIQQAAEAICREVSRPMLIDQRQATVLASVGAVGFQSAVCAAEAPAVYTDGDEARPARPYNRLNNPDAAQPACIHPPSTTSCQTRSPYARHCNSRYRRSSSYCIISRSSILSRAPSWARKRWFVGIIPNWVCRAPTHSFLSRNRTAWLFPWGPGC